MPGHVFKHLLVRHVPKHVLGHILEHVLWHLPVRHVLEDVPEHMPRHVPTKHLLEHVPGHVLKHMPQNRAPQPTLRIFGFKFVISKTRINTKKLGGVQTTPKKVF